jgi:hypothetical protein
MEIYKTEFQARKAAKKHFENILELKNVRVTTNTYSNTRYFNTTCICGETTLRYFTPIHISKKCENFLEKINMQEIGYAICPYCGQ